MTKMRLWSVGLNTAALGMRARGHNIKQDTRVGSGLAAALLLRCSASAIRLLTLYTVDPHLVGMMLWVLFLVGPGCVVYCFVCRIAGVLPAAMPLPPWLPSTSVIL